MSSSATFIKSAKITPTFPNDGKNYASTIDWGLTVIQRDTDWTFINSILPKQKDHKFKNLDNSWFCQQMLTTWVIFLVCQCKKENSRSHIPEHFSGQVEQWHPLSPQKDKSSHSCGLLMLTKINCHAYLWICSLSVSYQ